MTHFGRMIKADPYHDAHGQFTSASGAASGGASGNTTMKQVSGQKGSNPGGIYEDSQGVKHYVKFYANPDQAHVEELASKVFSLMGCQTTDPQVMQVNGKTALVTKWNPNIKEMGRNALTSLSPELKKQAAKMFYAAVLTKNWDVVGLEYDNLAKDTKTGNLVEVDTGGSFHFRAQGGPKPYGPDTNELTSLMDKTIPSGAVFHSVFSTSLGARHAGLEAVKNLDISKLKEYMDNSSLPNKDELFKNLVARRKSILEDH